MKPYVIILAIFFLILSCSGEKSSINGLKLQDEFCDTLIHDRFPNKKTFTDKYSRFSIDFPETWHPYEDIIDTVHGVVAGDSSIDFAKLGVIGVTEFVNDFNSLWEYFKADISEMTKDTNFRIYEIGKSKIDTLNAYWVFYKAPEDSFGDHRSIIYYIRRELTDTFYLLETAIYDSKNYRERLCNLKPILETFNFH